MDCELCHEGIEPGRQYNMGENSHMVAHRECLMREALGGIGHHLGHEYWCSIRRDPDAGLTRHQSAVLVLTLMELLGPETMAANAIPPT